MRNGRRLRVFPQLASVLFASVLGAVGFLSLPAAARSPAPTAPLTAIGASAFAELLAKMQRLSFGDEKLGLARAAGRGNFFTCEQITQLMRTSAFADDQVKIGAALYNKAVDPQNFLQLTSTLAGQSDRDKLRQLVGR
jgi:hypothetical protein